MAGHRAPVRRRQPDLLGFRDQVSDRQDKAIVADHDTLAEALGAQRLAVKASAGIVARRYDRRERLIEIIVQRPGVRLKLRGICQESDDRIDTSQSAAPGSGAPS